MIYFFGYGSLLCAKTINEHGLKDPIKESDLIDCDLDGFRREFNAYDLGDKQTYLGLIKSPESVVNGVIFPISNKGNDLKDLELSESNGILYKLIDVTDKINLEGLGKTKVFTEVTIRPTYNKIISKDYLKEIEEGLKIRGKEFEKEFYKSTFREPEKISIKNANSKPLSDIFKYISEKSF